jgi:circadian clock protein KaiC
MGRVRVAISAIKKRYGDHEKTIREFQITPNGIVVGEPLADFQGVLSGEPEYVGERRKLIE